MSRRPLAPRNCLARCGRGGQRILTPPMPGRPLGISGGRSRPFWRWRKRAPFEAGSWTWVVGPASTLSWPPAWDCTATGIDSAPAAIALAEAKARHRGLTAHFLVHDALQ